MVTNLSTAFSASRASSSVDGQVSVFGYWEGSLFVVPDKGHYFMSTRLSQQVTLWDRFGPDAFWSRDNTDKIR